MANQVQISEGKKMQVAVYFSKGFVDKIGLAKLKQKNRHKFLMQKMFEYPQ